jgi:hypothetical protein
MPLRLFVVSSDLEKRVVFWASAGYPLYLFGAKNTKKDTAPIPDAGFSRFIGINSLLHSISLP